jgi:hypothetical protein
VPTRPRSTKQQARLAGFLYLALLIAPFGLLYVPSKIIVSGNATTTADNLRAHGSLLRLGIGSELVHQVVAIFLLLALYRLFKPVDEYLSKQLIILGSLVSVPIMFVNVLNHLAALTLVSGSEWLSVFPKDQLDALAYLFVRLHGQGITVASIFWGLWLFPFGLLVIRSGFIPRWMGYALMLAGSGYLLNSFAILVFPQFSTFTGQISMPLQFGELPIMFYLAIWGARETRTTSG